MFNQVTMVGRLTRDATSSQLRNPQKTPVVRATLVVDRDYDVIDADTPVDYWPIEIVGADGERLAPHLQKGRLVLVNGSVHVDRRDTAGATRVIPYVRVRQLRFLDRPRTDIAE